MRILLTGGSGLLGAALRKCGIAADMPPREELDIRDTNAVSDYIRRHRPDVIIHAAAVTDNRAIERDPADAISTNIVGTANVVSACLGSRTRLVYISTDYVYRGDRGNYGEEDEMQPANIYAWTKLGGEASVRALPNHLIIRTSFGASTFDYPAAFTDKWSSKEYVDLIAPEILNAALSPLTGVLHVGGPRRTLHEYAAARNPDVGRIELHESAFASPRDTSLNLEKWHGFLGGKDIVRGITVCRVCGTADLLRYLDLGMMPLANNLADTALAAKQMRRFPMQVDYCPACSMSQLSVVVDPRAMFSHYTYRSSINKGYVAHCRRMAQSTREALGLVADDLVIDVAGNDGTLLAEFRDEIGVSVLNIDPAENIARIAESRGIPTINDFWSEKVAERISAEHGKPKLITATNVFAHVDDVREFVGAAGSCLSADGALMLEFPYGVDFIEKREFDTIYFEHLSYVLIEPVRQLAESLNMEVFDVQKQDIHGGTARVFIGHRGAHQVRSSVSQFLDAERAGGYHDADIYDAWSREIDSLISDTLEQLAKLKRSGARIAAFAASAKGNTFLNACRLDAGTIEYIVDDTPEKIGRFSPGTGIPIVDREKLKDEPPDYLLILAWNFAREIIESTTAYAAGGGRYIIGIPEFRVVEDAAGLTHD